MGGLQPIHILVLVIVALLIFAPGRLPEIIRGAKKGVSEFKSELSHKEKPAQAAEKKDTAQTGKQL